MAYDVSILILEQDIFVLVNIFSTISLRKSGSSILNRQVSHKYEILC